MGFKTLLDEAFHKGERVKEELLVEIVNSRLFHELTRTEAFAQAIETILKTKESISHLLHGRMKVLFDVLDLPSREEVEAMNAKVIRLSNQIERLGQRARIDSGKKALTSKGSLPQPSAGAQRTVSKRRISAKLPAKNRR